MDWNRLIEVFLKKNSELNLSAIRDEEGVRLKHIDDSLKILDTWILKPWMKVADIGTWWGFPLMPMAISCPDIEFVQLARPTKALVKYLQQVGRGLRPTESKSRCVILDNVGLHITFGLPDADHVWETYFEGEPMQRKSSSGGGGGISTIGERIEPSFDEGNDEMTLICEANAPQKSPTTSEKNISLKDDDIKLLRTLYVEKHCTLDILETIFNVPANIIANKLRDLNIYAEPQ